MLLFSFENRFQGMCIVYIQIYSTYNAYSRRSQWSMNRVRDADDTRCEMNWQNRRNKATARLRRPVCVLQRPRAAHNIIPRKEIYWHNSIPVILYV